MFVVIGLYFLFGRFLVDAWYRAKLHYVITNQRVILNSDFPLMKGVTSIDLASVRLQLDERSDGRGTIRLALGDMWSNLNWSPLHPCIGRPPHLFRIETPRDVYELLRSAIRTAGTK